MAATGAAYATVLAQAISVILSLILIKEMVFLLSFLEKV